MNNNNNFCNVNAEKFYRLTYPQRGIWLTEKTFPGTSISNIAGSMKIKEKVDIDLLKKAINIVLQLNDGLRMRIIEKDGEPLQYIADYEYEDFEVVDFTGKDIEEFYKWENENAKKPTQILNTPLYKFYIFILNENLGGVFACLHHIISDGWTIMSINDDLAEIYYKLKNNIEIKMETNPSYIEYIEKESEYIKSEKFNKDKEYWMNKFEGFEEVTTLKTRKTRSNSLEAKRKTFKLPKKLCLKISEYSEKNKVSPFSMFMSALLIYLKRVLQKEDIIVGTPILNRANAKEKEMMGMFISSIALRFNISDSINFKQVNAIVTKELRESLRHQRYPFECLRQDIKEKYGFNERIVDIFMSYQNYKYNTDIGLNFESRWHFNASSLDSLGIHINDREGTGEYLINYDYLKDLYYDKEIEFLHDHMIRLLWHGLDNDEKPICYLEMVSEREKHKILHEFNDTYADYPRDKFVNQLFEEQVEKTPDNVAIVFEGKEMTYVELNKRANQLAWRLRESGVKPEVIVGIMVERSFEMIIGILGVLKAGGAYLPIDPELPEDRIQYMIDNAKVGIFLSQSHLKDKIDFKGVVLYLDEESSYADKKENLDVLGDTSNLAYVIYTSGSTGKPKGVMVENRNVMNFIFGMIKDCPFEAQKTILCLTTFSFDIFGLEIFVPLSLGQKIILASKYEYIDSQKIADLISKYSVEMLQVTPSRMQILLSDYRFVESLNLLNAILIGGEELSISLLMNIKEYTTAKVYNMYGPTETTVWSALKLLEGMRKIDIGKPIMNTQIYILDKFKNLVPIGMIGEIYIGGDGVSRGYINNEELTKERFVENPYKKGDRIYRTGDLGRWYPKGDVYFEGRADNQVKIRGYRIELGEIESVISEYPNVDENVVTVVEGTNKNKVLCCYYISKVEIDSNDLKDSLTKALPKYMIPNIFVRLERFSYTPSGKLDRKKLPKPDFSKIISEKTDLPITSIEKKIANIWKTVLKIDSVGINDDFFEIGGDSLSAMVVISKINQKLKLDLKYSDLVENPTIKSIAKIKEFKSVTTNNGNNGSNLQEFEDIFEYLRFTNKNIKKAFENVLITGVTGFLGAHLLDEVLRNSNANVYCLVRDTEKLKKTLEYYFGNSYIKELNNRIIPVLGDIVHERLGMYEEIYKDLLNRIDTVFHSAAIVKHFGEYKLLEDVNVLGTKNVIEFCKNANAKLHHISTLSVSGERVLLQTRKNPVFKEHNLYIGQNFEQNIYVKSKFLAEVEVIREMKNGLSACIYRVGNVTWRYKDGLFQINPNENAFLNWIKALEKLHAGPRSMLNIKYDLTPVDLCAEAIYKLALTKDEYNNDVYHVFNNNLYNFFEILRMVDPSFSIPTNEEFRRAIKKYENDNSVKILMGYIEEFIKVRGNKKMILKCDKTLNELKELGFTWNKVDENYMKYINKISTEDICNV